MELAIQVRIEELPEGLYLEVAEAVSKRGDVFCPPSPAPLLNPPRQLH